MSDEGTLDPWVAEWMAANPMAAPTVEDLGPELLPLARGGPAGAPPEREIASVADDAVEGVPVRIYRGNGRPAGLLVYFHGGGFVMGSIGLMDNVARELAHHTGAVVVSVEYRLAPEHPYPAGLDDCEKVTRWACGNAARFDVSPRSVVVDGESAGGNLATAVALRAKAAGDLALAGQVLIYPVVAGGMAPHPSMDEFDGLVTSRRAADSYWSACSGGRDLGDDGCAVPLRAGDLSGLPPALVVLGGCDMLRAEGRAYAARLRAAGVAVDEVCYPGQPHGFVNFGLPATQAAFDHVGTLSSG